MISKSTRALTFDFWNTLARPNPHFAAARNNELHSFINGTRTVDEISTIYKTLKAELDQRAEARGEGFSTLDCFGFLLTELKAADEYPQYGKVVELMDRIQTIAMTFPPIITDDTVRMLKRVQSENLNVAIISNTNFISGNTIRQILTSRGIRIHTTVFSDECGFAKPTSEIFVNAMNQLSCSAEEFVHIGDSEICDLNGAHNIGSTCLHIKDPEDAVLRVMNWFTY